MPDDNPQLHPMAQAQVDAYTTIAPHEAEAKRQHVTGLLHQLEADLAPLIGPVVQKVIDNPATSDEIRALLNEAGVPAHQFGSLVIGFAIWGVLGPFLGAGLQPEIQDITNVAFSKNTTLPLSPALLAEMALKGISVTGEPQLGSADLATEAALSGVNPERFAAMTQAAGQSIGLAEALLIERRNQWPAGVTIDDALAYSNMNPKFYEAAKALKYAPPPAGEVIAGALKGWLQDADAQHRLGLAGIDPANYQWMKDSAGRPPGTQEMLHLWNLSEQGLIGTTVDESVVTQAVEQSDINNNYMAYVKELRHYFPPPRSIVPMLRSESITVDQATRLLKAYGVGDEWATAFVKEAHHTKTTAGKELTRAQIVDMYADRYLDAQTATADLTAIGYSQADITLLLGYADRQRAAKLQNQLIQTIRSLYTAHKLTRAEAVTALDGDQVPTAVQTDLFKVWDLERQARVHHPTPAQVVGAYRRGEIKANETKLRLNQLGVQNADLGLFVADGWPPSHPATAQQAAQLVIDNADAYAPGLAPSAPAPRRLTLRQVEDLYVAGTITYATALADLEAIGYTATDAANLLGLLKPAAPAVP
jgi:hypothetical protein